MTKKKLKIDEQKRKKCHAIIHSHAVAAGGAGAGLAQVPLADSAVITPIQIAMILELGAVFHQKITKSAAQAIITSAGASLIGRGVSQVLVGWIPGVGNAVNTATAASITETIGWIAVERFAEAEAVNKKTESEKTYTSENSNYSENISNAHEEDFADKVQEKEEIKKELLKEMEKFVCGELRYEENQDTYNVLDARGTEFFEDEPDNEIWCKFHEIQFN